MQSVLHEGLLAGQRMRVPSPGMPALVSIIDKYTELVDDAPDAIKHADSIARLGRAVAVTLVAATQRPGDLDITAVGRGGSWTSGRIQTQSNGFTAPDGAEMMVIASIEQPDPAHGAGYWPAFWLLGPGRSPGSGEIDILEDVDGLSEASSTFHCGNLAQRNPDGTFGLCHESTGLSSGLQRCLDCQTAYHTYSVIIDRHDESDQQIRWYIDGRQFFRVSESQVGPVPGLRQ